MQMRLYFLLAPLGINLGISGIFLSKGNVCDASIYIVKPVKMSGFSNDFKLFDRV